MQLNDLYKLAVKTEFSCLNDEIPYKFDVYVQEYKEDGVYVISFVVNGVHNFVSSQRCDKRLFKNLETVQRVLTNVGIRTFNFIGRGKQSDLSNQLAEEARKEEVTERLAAQFERIRVKAKAHSKANKDTD